VTWFAGLCESGSKRKTLPARQGEQRLFSEKVSSNVSISIPTATLRRAVLQEQAANDSPDIAAARKRFRRISSDGIMLAYSSATYQPIIQDQVDRAKLFLGQLTPTKRALASSYGLKHAAERGGRYVSNGAMICAAIVLGLKVKSSGGDFDLDPNCEIGVSRCAMRVASPVSRRMRSSV
jgi:hypothetical protein